MVTKKKGEEITNISPDSRIIFILSGTVTVDIPSSGIIQVKEGEIIFCPPHMAYTISGQTDLKYLRINIPDVIPLLYHFLPQKQRKEYEPDELCFQTLPVKSELTYYLANIEELVKSYNIDAVLAEIKTLELFYFLITYYEMEELCRFFAPVLSEKFKFTYFVLSNYQKVKTVEEFAKLSSYSLSGFEKQFYKVFKMPPYKWMIMKKKEKLYFEICETDKQIKQIAFESGFSSLSQLSDFCRKYMGESPARIRKKKQI